MTQHITQEQAVELAIKAGDEFAIHEAEFYTSLCNAAIQHYLDQRNAELPEPVAWLANYGGNVYTEAQLKQAVRDALDAQDVNAELVTALSMMLTLVRRNAPELSGKVLGYADTALANYKGAKA